MSNEKPREIPFTATHLNELRAEALAKAESLPSSPDETRLEEISTEEVCSKCNGTGRVQTQDDCAPSPESLPSGFDAGEMENLKAKAHNITHPYLRSMISRTEAYEACVQMAEWMIDRYIANRESLPLAASTKDSWEAIYKTLDHKLEVIINEWGCTAESPSGYSCEHCQVQEELDEAHTRARGLAVKFTPEIRIPKDAKIEVIHEPGEIKYLPPEGETAVLRESLEYCMQNKTKAIERIRELEAELANEKVRGIHTCHDECQRPLCVANRRIRELEVERDELNSVISSIREQVGAVSEDVKVDIARIISERHELKTEVKNWREGSKR